MSRSEDTRTGCRQLPRRYAACRFQDTVCPWSCASCPGYIIRQIRDHVRQAHVRLPVELFLFFGRLLALASPAALALLLLDFFGFGAGFSRVSVAVEPRETCPTMVVSRTVVTSASCIVPEGLWQQTPQRHAPSPSDPRWAGPRIRAGGAGTLWDANTPTLRPAFDVVPTDGRKLGQLGKYLALKPAPQVGYSSQQGHREAAFRQCVVDSATPTCYWAVPVCRVPISSDK